MGRFKILIFSVVFFLALITDTGGQWQPPAVAPRPLCASQIALANYACATLPYSKLLPPPPPSSSLSSNHDSQGSPVHTHHHGHHHRHHHKIPLSPIEENCCKWVQQVDSECVCELLSRLPAFLKRPIHNFSVIIGGSLSCNATYSCGGMKI
uniref:Bifunctional inhibitor/plant lipid transfer protein/seed storage helical domain-containing protein n=1 Tax=Cucumis melo TaxID=3656 RepID=A0A9I9DBE4_CUCME